MTSSASQTDRHPRKAFLALFLVEIWERFGYYGIASILVLYMVQRRGMGDARADVIWGTFSALSCSMPMLGGYVGDRVLGARRTLVLGAITLALGYLLLSVPLDETLFPAMGLIALGNGLFKINPSNLISRLYEGEHSKLDILFTLYYLSQNVGSFVSILLTPWIKDHPAWVIVLGPLRFDSWHLAFGLSSIGLTLGLLNYGAFSRYLRHYGTAADFRKLDVRKLLAVIAISLATAYLLSGVIRYRLAAIGVVCFFVLLLIYVFVHLLLTGKEHERSRVTACIIFIVMASIWSIYNQQIYTSLTLFALRNVEHHILGIPVSAAQFQDLNQFWLILLAAPLAWFYQRMGRTGRGDFSIASKYAVGLYLLAIAFFLYAAGSLTAHAGIVSSWWLVAGFAAQSLGELLISALGLSMVSQLVPEHSRGIIMGAWFLGTGVSLYVGGAIASLASVPNGAMAPTASLAVYTHLFWGLGAGALACAIVATVIIPLLERMMLEPHEALMQAGHNVLT